MIFSEMTGLDELSSIPSWKRCVTAERLSGLWRRRRAPARNKAISLSAARPKNKTHWHCRNHFFLFSTPFLCITIQKVLEHCLSSLEHCPCRTWRILALMLGSQVDCPAEPKLQNFHCCVQARLGKNAQTFAAVGTCCSALRILSRQLVLAESELGPI